MNTKHPKSLVLLLIILWGALSSPRNADAQNNEIAVGSCFKVLTYETNLHPCPGESDTGNYCGGTQGRRRADFNSWWGYEYQETPNYGWSGSGGFYDRDVTSGIEPSFYSRNAVWGSDTCTPGNSCSLWQAGDWASVSRNTCTIPGSPGVPVDFPICDGALNGDQGSTSSVRHGGYPLPYAADGGSLALACYGPGMTGCNPISGTSHECIDPDTGSIGLFINWGFYNCGSNGPATVPIDCPHGPGAWACGTQIDKERGWWYTVQGRCSCAQGCPQGWQCCAGTNECRPNCEDDTLSCDDHSDCGFMNGVCACGSCAPIPPVGCAQNSDCGDGNICVGGACVPNCGEGSCINDSQCAPGSCCRGGQCITGTMCDLATPTPTPTPTASATPTALSTATPTATSTPTADPPTTPNPSPSSTPTPTPTIPGADPTWTPTPSPTPDGDGIFLRE